VQALERRNDPGQDARHAGREALSLALMEARNGTLQWLALLEDAALPAVQASIGTSRAAPGATELSPWRRAGRIAWFQEYWIARHLQRQRGEASDPDATRLASVWPQADALFAPGVAASDTARPDASTLRQFLADTIDTTLELLAGTGDDDASLYFYRLALAHEDRQAEQFAAWAQAHAVALPAPAQAALLRPLVARAARAPLYFPALPCAGPWAARRGAGCRTASAGRTRSRCPSSRSTPSR
jgi:hypothetical protein